MDNPECKICGSPNTQILGIESFLFPTDSYLPDFHEYENFLCGSCGIVFSHPQIDEKKLSDFYNSGYWQSINDEGLSYGEDHFNGPIDFANSISSLKRAKNFFLAIERTTSKFPEITPRADDLIIDLGAYQGLFLHALRKRFKVQVIPCDYSHAGMDFAHSLLGMENARVTKDLFTETFDHKARFVTMVHVLEHISDPIRLLHHIRQNLLGEDGYLYVEVPNLFGHPLADPFHFFTFSSDSLQRTLDQAGFEIVEMFTNSFPPQHQNVWANDIQNIVCLARPGFSKADLPRVDTQVIRANIRRSYAQHSSRGVWRFFKTASRDIFRIAYLFVFAVLLERISPRFMMSMAHVVGVRKQRSNKITK